MDKWEEIGCIVWILVLPVTVTGMVCATVYAIAKLFAG